MMDKKIDIKFFGVAIIKTLNYDFSNSALTIMIKVYLSVASENIVKT